MFKEIRIDKRLLRLLKPSLVAIDHVSIEKDDVLVICAGFEDRVTACLEEAIKAKKNNFSVVVVEYLPHIKENKIDTIQRICSSSGLKITKITYDREDPSGIGDKLLECLANKNGNLFIDVSGMSRLLIVQLLSSLSSSIMYLEKCHILYAEALDYPPSMKEVQEALGKTDSNIDTTVMFLSSGVFDVMAVPELSSVALQGQPIRLIVFPSFNTDQLTALRAGLQPSYLSIIHGIPPDEKYLWRLDAISKLNGISSMQNHIEYTVCTLDYRKTLDLLLKIYDEYGTLEKIVVAPTGSKMQSVAVGLFRAFMNDIQIVFPMERSFESKNYTKGIKQIYLLSLKPYSDFLKEIRCTEA